MRHLIAFVVVAFLALPAAAQDTGFYAGGSIGQASANNTCDELGGSGISCDDKDTAWKIFAGYQVTRNFAAEFGYTNLGEINFALGGLTESIEATAFELVGIGILPVADRFSVYGKLGFYRAETEDSTNFGFSAEETNTDLTFGFGARFDVSRNFALRAEWQRYNDIGGGDIGEDDIDVISLGALFRF